MLRSVTIASLALVAACATVPATQAAGPVPADIATYDRSHDDQRMQEALSVEPLATERTASGKPAPRTDLALTTIELSVEAGAYIAAFVGAASEKDAGDAAIVWPTFKACRTDTTLTPLTLVIGPTHLLGPQHPSIRRLEIAPGACHFVSGQNIDVVGLPPSLAPFAQYQGQDAFKPLDAEAAEEAKNGFDARIASLQAEPPGKNRDLLLSDITTRPDRGPDRAESDPARLTLTLVN